MQTLTVPFGALQTERPDVMSGGGRGAVAPLLVCDNLRPRRYGPGSPYGDTFYQIPPIAELLGTFGADVVAASWYTAPASQATYLVVVTPGTVAYLDWTTARATGTYTTATLHTFSTSDAGRTACFAPVGTRLVIASEQADGTTETMLVAAEATAPSGSTPGTLSAAFPTGLLPSGVTVTLGTGTLDRGIYDTKHGVRVALLLRDGTIGPASLPVFVDATTPPNNISTFDETLALAAAQGDTSYEQGLTTPKLPQDFIDENPDLPAYAWIGNTADPDRYEVVRQEDGTAALDELVSLASGEALTKDYASSTAVSYQRRFPIEVNVTAVVNALTDELVAVGGQPLGSPLGVVGIVVLATAPVEKEIDIYRSPYYVVEQVRGAEATIKDLGTTFARGTTYDDDSVTQHTLRPGVVYGYGERLWLSDLTYDLVPPTFGVDNGGSGQTIKARVLLDQPDGETASVTSEAVEITALSLELARDVFAYPDRRAHTVEFYVLESGTYKLAEDGSGDALRYRLTVPPTGNVAYAEIETTAFSAGTDTLPDDAASVSEPRLIVATDPAKPLAVRPGTGLALPIGGSVRAFAVEQAPFSSGQVGQFPLLVFTSEAVLSVQYDSDTPIGLRVVTSARGLLSGCHGVAEMDGAVAFVAYDGVWTVSRGQLSDQPLTREIHTTAAPFLTGRAVVGFRRESDDLGLTRELRLADPAQSATLVLDIETGRWWRETGSSPATSRTAFLGDEATEGSGLLGFAPGGGILLEARDTETTPGTRHARAMALATHKLHLGNPMERKRLRRIGLRVNLPTDDAPPPEVYAEIEAGVSIRGIVWSGTYDRVTLHRALAISRGHATAPALRLTGTLPVGTALYGFDVQHTALGRTHRLRHPSS